MSSDNHQTQGKPEQVNLPQLPKLAQSGHVAHCNRCLSGLPSSQVEADASRLAIGFYCLGTLDLLGSVQSKISPGEAETWKEWIWEQQRSGKYGTGFKPSSYLTSDKLNDWDLEGFLEYDVPHLIMTYTAILSLAILRDDFTKLDRSGILQFLRSCQREDGSFTSFPSGGDSDLRQVYCAFAISSMLDDWSGMDVERAVSYIQQCISHEGGYSQQPTGEALGGTTYCALASLHLAPPPSSSHSSSSTTRHRITEEDRQRTIRWLFQNQTPSGGFSGRTNKVADACYCFWCGASLYILGAGDLVDTTSLASFLAQCQFKFGGIAKAPGSRPDPYHTYLSLAALSLFQPPPPEGDTSWTLPRLDPLLNATEETVSWIKSHLSHSQSK